MVARRNPHKARAAKQRKRFVRKGAAAQRTKVGQSLKKQLGRGAFTIGAPESITIERSIDVGIAVGRNMGQPVQRGGRSRTTGRFQSTHGAQEVISRVSEGIRSRIVVDLPTLDVAVPSSGNVASSWIAYLEWNPTNRTVTMGLLSGWNYVYRMPFSLYQGWYYANSKGTFWHTHLRVRYYHNYINKYWLP